MRRRSGVTSVRSYVTGVPSLAPSSEQAAVHCLTFLPSERFRGIPDMDCTQEILHWLARNDLQELADRFQHHKINSLRRLYSLNLHLIRELIPEIGLRTDFMECWTQFKLRGTLRESFDINGTDLSGRSNISFPTSARMVTKPQENPVQIVELHPSNQTPNVGVVEYSGRSNMSYLQRLNPGVSDLANRSTLCSIPPRLTTSQRPIELVELDAYQTFDDSGDKYCRNTIVSIQNPRSVANSPDENPFEMILGHSEDSICEEITAEKSNSVQNVEHCTSTVNGNQVYSEVHCEEKADSGWGSSSSSIQTVPKNKSHSKKPQKGVKRKKSELGSDAVEKRQDTSNSYDKLRTLVGIYKDFTVKNSKELHVTTEGKMLTTFISIRIQGTIPADAWSTPAKWRENRDMGDYLMSFDEKSKAAIENFKCNGWLTDRDRSAICNAVARLLMRENQISGVEYHLAAQKICEVFPNENEILYYCPPDISKKKPSGKLVYKVKNIKNSKTQNKELQMYIHGLCESL